MTQKRKRYDKQFKIAEARVVLGGEMRAVDLARELGIKGSTLRRWAQEHGGMGENAFPENGSPKVTSLRSSCRTRSHVYSRVARANNLPALFHRTHIGSDLALCRFGCIYTYRGAGKPK